MCGWAFGMQAAAKQNHKKKEKHLTLVKVNAMGLDNDEMRRPAKASA